MWGVDRKMKGKGHLRKMALYGSVQRENNRAG